MTREQAIPYISFCVDDAQSYRSIDEMPGNARLVGWQCGFEPLFVAVWSYLDVRIDDSDAEDIASHLLVERGWFADTGHRPPDYII